MNNKETLKKIFAASYDQEIWVRQLRYIFPDKIEIFLQPVSVETNQVEKFLHLGNLTTANGKKLGIYETKVADNTQLARNRVQLRNLVARHIKSEGLDGALSVYYGKKSLWRFSYIAVEHKFDEQNQLHTDETAYKRYTYLLGKGAQTRTAVNRFAILQPIPTLAQLSEAFAVETLNQEFYKKLYQWYEYAQSQGQVTFPNDEGRNKDEHIASSLIRLITRLLFVWFLKEKGLINSDLFDKQKVEQLIDWRQSGSFYKAILQNLFFATLNRGIEERSFRTTTKGKADSNNYLVTNVYRYQDYFQDKDKDRIIELFEKTPFLNGGLFECLDREATDEEKEAYDFNPSVRKEKHAIRIDGFSDRTDNSINLPNELFFNDSERQLGLINLLDQYQFTVEESAPLDIEVALDPELLGKAFENLLASYNPETGKNARKASGSYYTPREIVTYMVDESLKAHLRQSVTPEDGDMKFFGERLDDLFDVADKTGELDSNEDIVIYESEKEPLIEVISNARIIDPAVGSGAFPMGVLQRMVNLLSVLDPDNEKWEAQQLRQLPSLKSIEQDLKTASNINDEQAREKAEEELQKRRREIEDLFRRQDQNYLRKLYLIENCIFGVDIQPIAIQIAKLRFFISLVIEQNPDSEADNYGILALPNLETKFIVANSLIGLNKPKQGVLYSEDVKSKEKKLHQIRHKYFNAKTLRTKRKYQQLDKEIRTEIARLLETDCWDAVDARKIADWDPYNQNAIANWFDPEWMFGVNEGFNIVIGNPPYVKTEHIPQKQREELKRFFGWKGDLYDHFIFRGHNLAANGAMLAYIANDSFINFGNKKRIRELFLQNCLFHLVKAPAQTFDAQIYTAIFLLQKSMPENTWHYQTGRMGFPDFIYNRIGRVSYNTVRATQGLKLLMDEENPLLRFLSGFPKVDHYLQVLDTGIHSGNVRSKLFFTEKREGLHRLLQGKQIGRYALQWHNPKAKFLYCDINYKVKPIKGIGRSGKPSSKNEYWKILGEVENHHQIERLLMRQTDDDLVVAYQNELDDGRFYTDNTLFTILPKQDEVNLKFALGVLNSRFMNSLYHFVAQERGKAQAQVKVQTVKNLPFILPDESVQQPIKTLVDDILAEKKSNPNADTSAKEAEVDCLVYALYGLTPEEISAIEGLQS